MKKKRKQQGAEVIDPLTLEMLRFYRTADVRTKVAFARCLEGIAVEKMPMDLAAGLYYLEREGADPDFIAAWRRQRLGVAS